MDGYFLNINKPKGITSFDVIYRLRKILNTKKIGHSGTLDPFAQGVMQVAIGSATRLLKYLNSNKEYLAIVRFGYNSTTLDIEGEITKLDEPNFTKDDLICALKNFKGEITQIPPKYSAIKVGGKKLYEYARKNIEVEIPKRRVTIFDIKLLEFNDYEAKILVSCSKGTYIRTLAQDIAKALGTDAYLTELIRTKAGNFKIENSIEIENSNNPNFRVSPELAIELESLELTDSEFSLVKNGVAIDCNKEITSPVMLIYNNSLVSIGILSDNKIKIKKFFNQN